MGMALVYVADNMAYSTPTRPEYVHCAKHNALTMVHALEKTYVFYQDIRQSLWCPPDWGYT